MTAEGFKKCLKKKNPPSLVAETIYKIYVCTKPVYTYILAKI